MKITEKEIDVILEMYEIVTWWGHETKTMANLVKRIVKEKKR